MLAGIGKCVRVSVPKAPGTSTPPVAGKKRRRNRWSDAPPSESLPVVPTPSQHLEMAGVATSLNVTPPLPSGQSGTGGQELTPLQLQQIKEQIEVSTLGHWGTGVLGHWALGHWGTGVLGHWVTGALGHYGIL